MGNFNGLEVWKESKELAVEVYKVTNKEGFVKDYSLRDQIRRAVVSIPSNLAEGEESGSEKGSIRYFHIANASLAELRTQIEIAKEIGYIRDTDYQALEDSMVLLSKRINKLLQYRQRQLK